MRLSPFPLRSSLSVCLLVGALPLTTPGEPQSAIDPHAVYDELIITPTSADNGMATSNLLTHADLISEPVSQTESEPQESLPASMVNPKEEMSLPKEVNGFPTMMIDEFTVNKDVRLGPVLRALARMADVNIIFGEDIENIGPFRFRLNNPTPWNEVLQSILNVYHLSADVNGKIITVMTLEDMELRYELQKQKNNQLMLTLQEEAMSPLSVQVIKIKYIKAEALVQPLTKILEQSAREEDSEMRGSISADQPSNSLILQAPPSDIDRLVSLLNIMDKKARQVRIEASIVEVSSQFAYELGVKWSFHGNAPLRAPEETRAVAEVSPMQMSNEGVFQLSDATYETMQGMIDSSTGAIDYGIIGRDFAVGMNLKALEEDGKLKILSSPSLTTMENQKALIKSGSDIPFRTEDDEGRPVVEYKEAVLSLDVLPQIVDDLAIYMDVAITKDEPDFSQTVDGNPLVLKKYVESRMMVLDGQTAVIAGLSKNSNFNKDGGIPYLRKIPFIGRLFSTKIKQESEEELMVFLTPRIVPNSALDNSEVIAAWMDKVYYNSELSLTERQKSGGGFANVDFMDASTVTNFNETPSTDSETTE